jgi:hypothetical protein
MIDPRQRAFRAATLVGASLLLHAGGIAAKEKATAAPTAAEATPTAGAAATELTVAGTPVAASRDPVVVAVRLSRQLQAQAADATKAAIELAAKTETMSQARRQMLLAAGSLYNSCVQLKRVAQKESERAARWQARGEQKERVAGTLDSEEDKTATIGRAKAHLAYSRTQNRMASAMLDFASQQEGLSKQTEAVANKGDAAAFAEIHKKIDQGRKQADQLYDDVTRTRAKLDTMLP